MVTLIGIILLALGVSLAVVWQTSVVGVLMGIIPLFLIFGGVLVVLIGYAEVKARREYREAVNQDDSEAPPATNAEPAKSNRSRYTRPQSTAVTTSTSNPASANTPSSVQPTPPNRST